MLNLAAVSVGRSSIGRRAATIVLACLTTSAALIGAPAMAYAGSVPTAATANESLAGEWLSQASGTVYDFDEITDGSFSGYVVSGGCASAPGDIQDTVAKNGHYTGTENIFSSFNPCTIAGTATNTIQISANGKKAAWDSSGCSDCGPQEWTRLTPLWGFDTNDSASTAYLNSRSIAKLGKPHFVGQYIEGNTSRVRDLTPAVAADIHAKGARILLIAYPNNHLTSAKQAAADAALAVKAAKKLKVRAGVAVFRDVESTVPITASYVSAWVHAIRSAGYTPGFYENPNEGSFAKAYCQVVANSPAIETETVLYSDQRNLQKLSKDASEAPAWDPDSPIPDGCGSRTIAWQYRINPDYGMKPNVDDAEVLPRDIQYLW